MMSPFRILSCKKRIHASAVFRALIQICPRLDCYEGYPNHYDRINMKVRMDNGQHVKAITIDR